VSEWQTLQTGYYTKCIKENIDKVITTTKYCEITAISYGHVQLPDIVTAWKDDDGD